jgi:hypothetical protein
LERGSAADVAAGPAFSPSILTGDLLFEKIPQAGPGG